MNQRELTANDQLVAYCGLYCGACGSYLKGRCPGCHDNAKAKWCKIRACCTEHGFKSCAECTSHPDPNSCALFNNFVSRLIGFVLRSNRQACILKIRELGLAPYAQFMTQQRRQTLPRQ
jgi:hypothetical protein